MLISIDFNSDEAIYMQVRNQIILGIAADRIREGDALPSVRQLADDIGIIHEGNLLEESSMDELRKKNQKYVLFRVSSTVTAARILEQKCGGVNYLIEDDNVMRVYDTDIDLSRINQEFITNNIGVYESRVCDESLEDYFKEITGGVGIA